VAGVPRPSYNTGTGFFTLNAKLYDANGVQFIPMGMDACHYDQSWSSCKTDCGISNSGANTVRVFEYAFTNTAQTNKFMNTLKSEHVVSIPTCGTTPSCSATSCQGDSTPCLDECATQWVNAYSTFKPFERYTMLNLANEWGSGTSTTWRDAYVAAVAKMRAAGYTATLVIDTGGCGKVIDGIINYAQYIYDQDPQHNILFSYHAYDITDLQPCPGECTTDGSNTLMSTKVKALAAAQTATADTYGGFPVMIGEFGPGNRADGAMCTPLGVMQEADSLGLGWIAWAWDDGAPFNIEVAGTGSGNFSLTGGVPTNCTTGSPCTNASDLSVFGNTVILTPTYGLFYAQPPKATVF
jgi:mannan endo-1,4-beta-mannosidase